VPIVRASTKGQIVIPAVLRKEMGISAGTYIRIERADGGLALMPLGPNLVEAMNGILADAGPVTDALMAERRAGCEREEAEVGPPIDPIDFACGMFAHLGPGTAGLEAERRWECEMEEKDLPPPGGRDGAG